MRRGKRVVCTEWRCERVSLCKLQTTEHRANDGAAETNVKQSRSPSANFSSKYKEIRGRATTTSNYYRFLALFYFVPVSRSFTKHYVPIDLMAHHTCDTSVAAATAVVVIVIITAVCACTCATVTVDGASTLSAALTRRRFYFAIRLCAGTHSVRLSCLPCVRFHFCFAVCERKS